MAQLQFYNGEVNQNIASARARKVASIYNSIAEHDDVLGWVDPFGGHSDNYRLDAIAFMTNLERANPIWVIGYKLLWAV